VADAEHHGGGQSSGEHHGGCQSSGEHSRSLIAYDH
jgi:hypothetical protein